MQPGVHERHTIDELATKYRLEPELRDIFVEGRSDKNFLEWHLSDQLANNPLTKIYAISDRVSIPDDDVIEESFLSGERGRILCLAKGISSRIPDQNSALFVADKDFVGLLADAAPQFRGLLYTDYSSMEAYAFNERTLAKLLKVGMGADESVVASDLIRAVAPHLKTLFVIRLCLRDSGSRAKITEKVLGRWGLEEPTADKIIEVFRVALNQVSIEHRIPVTPQELHTTFLSRIERTEGEIRNFINGHDISFMIVRFIKENHKHLFNADGRRNFQDPETMETLLMSCVEWRDIEHAGLFQSIQKWVLRLADANSQ